MFIEERLQSVLSIDCGGQGGTLFNFFRRIVLFLVYFKKRILKKACAANQRMRNNEK